MTYTHEEVCKLIVQVRDMARLHPKRPIVPVELDGKIIGFLYEDDEVAEQRWLQWLKEVNIMPDI